MRVRSVGIQAQHLPVAVSPVSHRSRRQFPLTQSDEGAVEPQPVLLVDVVVILHGAAFGLPAERGLRDDQQAARQLQQRRQPPRFGFAQPQVQKGGHCGGEEGTVIPSHTGTQT